MHRQGNKKLETSTEEKELEVLVDAKLNMSQQSCSSPEGQLCPGMHQAQHCQQGKHWNRLPWAVVMASSLSVLRKCLDNAIRHMVGFLWCPAQDWELDTIPMGPFQVSRFYVTSTSPIAPPRAGSWPQLLARSVTVTLPAGAPNPVPLLSRARSDAHSADQGPKLPLPCQGNDRLRGMKVQDRTQWKHPAQLPLGAGASPQCRTRSSC